MRSTKQIVARWVDPTWFRMVKGRFDLTMVQDVFGCTWYVRVMGVPQATEMPLFSREPTDFIAESSGLVGAGTALPSLAIMEPLLSISQIAIIIHE